MNVDKKGPIKPPYCKLLRTDLSDTHQVCQEGLNIYEGPPGDGLRFTDLYHLSWELADFMNESSLYLAEVSFPSDANIDLRGSWNDFAEADKMILLNILPFWDFIKLHHLVEETIKNYPSTFTFFENPTEEQKNEFFRLNPWVIAFIKDPPIEMQMEAVKKDEHLAWCIPNLHREAQLFLVNKNPRSVEFIHNPDEEVQMIGVKYNPHMLEHVLNPTKEVQLWVANNCHSQYMKMIKKPCIEALHITLNAAWPSMDDRIYTAKRFIEALVVNIHDDSDALEHLAYLVKDGDCKTDCERIHKMKLTLAKDFGVNPKIVKQIDNFTFPEFFGVLYGSPRNHACWRNPMIDQSKFLDSH